MSTETELGKTSELEVFRFRVAESRKLLERYRATRADLKDAIYSTQQALAESYQVLEKAKRIRK